MENLKIEDEDFNELIDYIGDIGLYLHLLFGNTNKKLPYDIAHYNNHMAHSFERILRIMIRYTPFTDNLVYEIKNFSEGINNLEIDSADRMPLNNMLYLFDTIQLDLIKSISFANKNYFSEEFCNTHLIPLISSISQVNSILNQDETEEIEFFLELEGA